MVRDNVNGFTRYLVFCNPIVFLWGHRLVPTHHGHSLPICDMDKHGRFSDENGSRTEQRSQGYLHKAFGRPSQARLDVSRERTDRLVRDR